MDISIRNILYNITTCVYSANIDNQQKKDKKLQQWTVYIIFDSKQTTSMKKLTKSGNDEKGQVCLLDMFENWQYSQNGSFTLF